MEAIFWLLEQICKAEILNSQLVSSKDLQKADFIQKQVNPLEVLMALGKLFDWWVLMGCKV